MQIVELYTTLIICVNNFIGLTINFLATDYFVVEEGGFVTIQMIIREAEIPFTLTLTPTTIDDVLADTRIRATDYLREAYSTLSAAGKAEPGCNLESTCIIGMYYVRICTIRNHVPLEIFFHGFRNYDSIDTFIENSRLIGRIVYCFVRAEGQLIYSL